MEILLVVWLTYQELLTLTVNQQQPNHQPTYPNIHTRDWKQNQTRTELEPTFWKETNRINLQSDLGTTSMIWYRGCQVPIAGMQIILLI